MSYLSHLQCTTCGTRLSADQPLRDTGGAACTATNDESTEAASQIVLTEGIFPCPESAKTLVALKKALADGILEEDATVVLLSTGSGLKSIDVFPMPEITKTNANTPLISNK
jgi:threonine synthase